MLDEEVERPDHLSANAWDGTEVLRSNLLKDTEWGHTSHVAEPPLTRLAGPSPADERDWRHPKVGWGLILPENEDLEPRDRATAIDAPDAIRRLMAKRQSRTVLRWPKNARNYIRSYSETGRCTSLSLQSSGHGIGKDLIPKYLLIYGSPTAIPWSAQYALNMGSFVGRLDLEGAALEAYTDAVESDWSGQASNPLAPVIWSVDHGGSDITTLMARGLGEKIWQKFLADPDLGRASFLTAEDATNAGLMKRLIEGRPGLVITTSHGLTAPLGESGNLRDQLGLPVDGEFNALALDDLKLWEPNGAVWYSHACCSAGSDGVSGYEALFPESTKVGAMLRRVAASAGATTSPIAREMLGSKKPLRAFIGHVEPTFDWSLRDIANKQLLSHTLVECLYDRLYREHAANPVGWALQAIFAEAGRHLAAWSRSTAGKSATAALYHQLVAKDRQSTVIIGDPAVSMF